MSGMKIISKNKRVGYDFFLEEKFEAGIVLSGTEVKSLRGGKVKIDDAYVYIDAQGEVWIQNMNIAHYEFGNINNLPENRKRKLLLNRSEIIELKKGINLKSLTIVPTMIYFKDSRVKLEIALAKGKKLYDKREDKAKKEVSRKLKNADYE
jgi:SsrA-binding protein